MPTQTDRGPLTAVVVFAVSGVMSWFRLNAAISPDLPGTNTVSSTNLTVPFHTRGDWQFVIRQDPSQETGLGTEPGNLHFCFVKKAAPSCFNSELNALGSSQIVYPTPASPAPVLVVSLVDQVSVTGGGRSTLIWAYNAESDRFDQLFDDTVNRNTNGEIRFITNGALAGDVVVGSAGERPPYRYHIAVCRLENSTCKEILTYDGNSKYNDGNALAVIDAEVPEIERRLHLWKTGDPLPIPARTHCSSLVIKHRVEWCGQ